MKKRDLLAPLLFFLSTSGVWAAENRVFSAPADLRGSLFDRILPSSFEARLAELAPLPEGGFPSSGTLTLAAFPVPPFDTLVASWNVDTPSGTAVEVWAQVRVGNAWTDWLSFGIWGAEGGQSVENESKTVLMDIDTLKIKKRRKADAFRLKAVLWSRDGKETPLLRLLAATLADTTSGVLPEPGFSKGPWVRELSVPERSQMTESEDIRHDICSPTSLSMLLAFWGHDLKTAEVSRQVYDHGSKKYGNWPYNMALAARRGLRAYVARLDSLSDLQDEIASGRPVAVSITFGKGELAGAPMKRSKGHLLVVRGFTETGDVIVNDPTAPDPASVRRVYNRKEFRKAWLENKHGLAYLVRPRWPTDLAVGCTYMNLWEKAVPGSGTPEDKERLTQLLFGESVRVVKVQGGRSQIEALEQQHRIGGAWGGYPGWLKTDCLFTPTGHFKPDAIISRTGVEARRLDPEGGKNSLLLPLGTRVMRIWRQNTLYPQPDLPFLMTIRFSDGTEASVDPGSVQELPLPDETSRREKVLRVAGLFVGKKYLWGGLSSIQEKSDWGVDCSGLVSISHRVAGLEVPRDAQDQYLAAKSIPSARKAGDLVFLSRPGQPDQIGHVAIFAGGDDLIESVESGGARRTSFQERFGKTREGLASGDKIGERTVYFGTFLDGGERELQKAEESKGE